MDIALDKSILLFLRSYAHFGFRTKKCTKLRNLYKIDKIRKKLKLILEKKLTSVLGFFFLILCNTQKNKYLLIHRPS